MAYTTNIEWAESSWNPITGCTKYSAGCKNCYAERIANWQQKEGNEKYANGFKLTLHPMTLNLPAFMKDPKRISVCSMSDLFHYDVPEDFIYKVFRMMNRYDHHQYFIQTKRSDRLLDMSTRLPWGDHIWAGVTVENAQYQYRIDHLRHSDVPHRFVHIEPLLGPLPDLNLESIEWVVVGGETGYNARPMASEWVLQIRDQVKVAGIPFFFTQWGGNMRMERGNIIQGRHWLEMPSFHNAAKLRCVI